MAVNEEEQRIRFGTCKRNPDRLPGTVDSLVRSAGRFLDAHGRFAGWRIDYVAIAPDIDPALRVELSARGVIPQSLGDLLVGL